MIKTKRKLGLNDRLSKMISTLEYLNNLIQTHIIGDRHDQILLHGLTFKQYINEMTAKSFLLYIFSSSFCSSYRYFLSGTVLSRVHFYYIIFRFVCYLKSYVLTLSRLYKIPIVIRLVKCKICITFFYSDTLLVSFLAQYFYKQLINTILVTYYFFMYNKYLYKQNTYK